MPDVLKLLKKYKNYGPEKLIRFAGIELRAKLYRILRHSYSQSQEDLLIDKYLKKKAGFYVDIGATDGRWYSNTQYFYDKGWRGINIEPDPRNYEQLTKNRPGDTNVIVGIGSRAEELPLYRFMSPVLSTMSQITKSEFVDEGYEFLDETVVSVDTLENILDKYTSGRQIDFLTLDTEGYDYLILKSNNWQKYMPLLICVESETKHRLEGAVSGNDIHSLLTGLGYRLRSDNHINTIFTL